MSDTVVRRGPWLVVPAEMELLGGPVTNRRRTSSLVCLELDAEFMRAYRLACAMEAARVARQAKPEVVS